MQANRVRLSAELCEITPEIFTTASAIVGVRGSGKTNDGVLLAEEAIRFGVPPVIIDPTSAWWGLKSSPDGKSAGLPVYIFGGERGDVPLEPTSGPIIARFVVEERVPVILDVSDLTKGKQRRFVGEFCTTLYDLKNRRRDPLFLIIDEVPRFCPQQLQKDPDLLQCVGAVEDIVALGRSRGLGCAIIGQRSATINNNVLTQADNLFAMRSVGTADRKAIDAWVVEAQGDQQQRDEMIRHLAALPQGEGYFWSPAIFGVFRRVKFAARSTFDSSRTPRVGEKRVEPKVFASVDLDKLRGEIAATVERAKADDPKALRATIADLQKKLAVKGAADPAEVMQLRRDIAEARLAIVELEARPVERVEVPVVGEKAIAALREIVESVALAVDALQGASAQLPAVVAPIADALRAARAPIPVRPEPAVRPQRPVLSSVPAKPATAPRAANPSDDSLGGGATKVLVALARVLGGQATRDQLALLSGYTNTGGFRNLLSELRAAAVIEDVDGARSVAITAHGQALLVGHRVELHQHEELVDLWRPKLDGGATKLFDAMRELHAAGEEWVTRDRLAAKTGYANAGGFRNLLSDLRKPGLIDEQKIGSELTLRLHPTLYAEGVR